MNVIQDGGSVRQREFQLPPLILHPFAGASGPNKLLEGGRAGLRLDSLLAPGNAAKSPDANLLEGRYHELRMLFYVGRDLTRWVDQCLDVAHRSPESFPQEICSLTFIAYLAEDTPATVREKLQNWGVKDYSSIFRRALVLNMIFADLPGPELLSAEFVLNYHRYADILLTRRLKEDAFTRLNSHQFT